MATLDQLSAALIKADAAGNADDARAFANEIRKMRQPEAPKEQGYIESAAAGLGSGVGRVALGAQHYLGKGLGAVGAESAGNWLVNDAAQGRAKLAGEVAPYKAANPMTTGGGELAGEIAATWPVGGLLGAGAKAAGASRLGTALSTSGMTAGTAAPGAAGWIGNQAIRAGASATVGGASAGLVDPDSAGVGAIIGGMTPGVLQLAGKFGATVYNAVKGGRPGAGKMLADAMGVSGDELQAIIKAANAAPESLVEGSKLTLSQSLQQQGANQPGVKMLTKIVGEGPGGNTLLKRYADQGAARLDALTKQGAQTYQGAVATEGDTVGNRLAAMLRTQNADENAAVRAAWGSAEPGQLSGVHGRAVNEGSMLQLPIDRMKSTVADRMGDGYTGGRSAVDRNMSEAMRIGIDTIPAMQPLAREAASKSQNLEQAVRSAGGIKLGKSGLSGELRDLGIRESGTTGLINNKSGRSVDLLAEEMYRRGFIPDNDSATLLEALRNKGGRNLFANDQVESSAMQRMSESAMGDLPGEQILSKAVPFKSFQALRSSSGQDAARLSEKTGNRVEAGVMTDFEKLMAARADNAAAGNLLPGESMSTGLMAEYNAARNLTRDFHERYTGGPIEAIVRKPVGQNFRLEGNEVTNKLWHGGAGLAGDVSRLKQVLSDNNQEPAMNALRQFIMTEAAGKTTAAGNFGAALPRYVESRLSGLQEAMNPNQLKALMGVASDIRNADAASNVAGLTGSDSYAKLTRAMESGLLDSTLAKGIGKIGIKGVNLDLLRAPAAEMMVKHKGKAMAELLANPKAAAAALADAQFVKSADSEVVRLLRVSVARALPILAAD